MYDGLALVFLLTTENRRACRHASVTKEWGRAEVVGVRPHPRCACTQVGLPQNRLRLVGSLVGLGLSCGCVSAQMSHEDGLLHFFPLHISKNVFFALCFLLCFVHFHLFSGICLQNMFSRNTSGTRLTIYAYVSKFVYFSYFGL
jgi:hypothetical protein